MLQLRSILSIALSASLITNASAQRIASAEQTGQTASLAAAVGLQAKISVNLDAVGFTEALEMIAKQAGLKIVIADAVHDVHKRVTMSARSITAEDAFAGVLRGTAVRMVVNPDGRIGFAVQTKNQSQGVITGTVIDAKTGKGISGVSVSVGSTHGTTRDDGAYRLIGVAAGTQMVTVRLVGYAKQVRTVTVGDGATVTADFKLEPSANVLDQVVVTGSVVATELKAVPSAITVITAKQIEERGITRIDQLFRGDVPGLFAMELGASTLTNFNEVIMFSRGASDLSSNTGSPLEYTNPIKTYVDGIEMADSKYLSQIDPSSIERIEILSGPQASTIYGANAINGVMQIFTKRGSTARPRVMLNLLESFTQNNFSSGLAPNHEYTGNVSGLEGRFSYATGASWDYTGAWSPGKQVQRTSVYGGGKQQVGSFSVDFSARRGWTQNKVRGEQSQIRTALAQSGTYIYSSTIQSTGLVQPTDYALHGGTLGLTLNYAPVSWWSHQITAGSDESESSIFVLEPSFVTPSDTAPVPSSRSITDLVRRSQSYSSTLRIPITSVFQTTLTYGVDRWRTNSTLQTWSLNLAGATQSPFVNIGKSKNKGAYVQGQLSVFDALFLTYGVRADWNPNFGERAQVRPGRYGASYSRDVGSVTAKLRGSYGRAIRPPALTDQQGTFNNVNASRIAIFGDPLWTILPNPELGPEFQEGGEGGIELYYGNRGSLVLTRYNQTVDGLIHYVSAIDSVRASVPGILSTNFSSACSTPEDVRSDGYCYSLQDQRANVGSIRNQGWEMQSSINVGPFVTGGTYSWTKSRVIGITQKYRALLTGQAFIPGQTFNYAPEHTWALNLAYNKFSTSMSLNINGTGLAFRDVGQTELAVIASNSRRLRTQEGYRIGTPTGYRSAVPGYTKANFNASHSFSKSVDALLRITNLTDFYQNDAAFLAPSVGRQSSIGVRIKY